MAIKTTITDKGVRQTDGRAGSFTVTVPVELADVTIETLSGSNIYSTQFSGSIMVTDVLSVRDTITTLDINALGNITASNIIVNSLAIHDNLSSGHSSTGNMLVTGSLGITGSATVGSVVSLGSISGSTLAVNSISSQNKISFWQSQNGGWKDLIGDPIARKAVGPTVPAYSQMGAGPFYAYQFAIGDILNFVYHIPHDWAVGSPLYLHAHWTADLTSANTVKWEFTWDTAKGYSRGTFSQTGSVVTAQQAMTGAIWTHTISEVQTIQDNSIETDGILLLSLKRITNGGTECTSSIFLMTADCHYQATQLATKNRNYPFD